MPLGTQNSVRYHFGQHHMQQMTQITGTLEVTGSRKFQNTGAFYSELCIKCDDDRVRLLTNVIIPNTVDSFLFSGVKGSFFITPANKGKKLLFAFSDEKKQVYDRTDVSLFNKLTLLNFVVWGVVAVMSIPLISYYAGAILLPVALFCMRSSLNTYRNTRSKRLERYLAKRSFDTKWGQSNLY